MRSVLCDRMGDKSIWTADIIKIREFKKGGQLIREYVLSNIFNEWFTVKLDHMIWRLGRDVPKIPLVYSRLGKNIHIKFIGKVIQYKKWDGIDYKIQLIKILETEKL